MASPVEKSKYMLWFREHSFAVMLQRKIRTVFGREAPSNMSCYELFDPTGCIFKGKIPGRRPLIEVQVDQFQEAFVSSLRPNQAGMLADN
jgi:hypothetical protein